MAVKYSNSSNYSNTSMNKKYLNVYNPRLTLNNLNVLIWLRPRLSFRLCLSEFICSGHGQER
jgi:hypothetical protein